MKKFKKIISLFILGILMSTFVVGCGSNNVESKDNKVTVVDQLGREVELDGTPEKIISSYYISTSLLINLGVQDKLVGIEAKAKTREMYKKVAKELIDLPAVGTSKEINIEECANLNPDLVIIPTRLKEFIPKFEELKIPVIAIEPETLDQFKETVKLIGKAVGKEEKANKLVNYYDDTISKVKELNKNLTEKQNVYLAGSDSVLKTCTSKMYQNYMFEVCGGENVTKELTDGYWTTISVEELVKKNPDVIYMVGYASYSKDDILKDERLKGVNAINNNKVYVFPSTLEAWDYPTPSSMLGILWLENNLHPDLYSKEDYIKDAKEFYKEFYDIEVSEEELGL
ncbi:MULTISPECIES: ABC transporter substrate-binding protein [Clostridium]|uniref:ABC transporter substrate-binding protein n=1 Tax=Clostridium TaxID=1485 RepID=UPI0028FE6602|nr:ABC transporter substrate-binding protein [Clostridium sp.]MBS7129385.1 ABC transporter substrate-binding protein [Clostridium sp.]MDU2282508.1 ABC transporter substrate-binding protein [Clostridium sp.]